ncbi:protein FAR1-RELATED SEQUENCE 2-like [Apium graveolens]|uniref:protein FAR1-RELATED SEQUENCE 2-like n=1 Tax=Apium graveolens TaxID=4045 RepID=UPI003D7B3246
MESEVENQWTNKENNEEDKESDQLVVEEENTEGDKDEENVEKLSPPKVNKLFDSETEVYEYYRLYGLQKGFGVTIRNTRKIDGVNIYLTVACHRYGDADRKVMDSLNPKPIVKSSCKARICAKREEDDKWRVTQFDNEHNHDLSPSKVYRFDSIEN